jgi:hypothetical protein
MTFFKNLPELPATAPTAVERRSEQRFAVHPDFPLKAVLSFIGRDDTGAPLSGSRHGWNWKGRLIEFSGAGARVQMGPGVRAEAGDECDLTLTVEDLEVMIPSRIANIREDPAGPVFGLQHAIEDEKVWNDYRLLLEAVSLGATLEPKFRLTEPDESGFVPEQYAGDWGSRLTAWRHPKDESVVAFELMLNDGAVRAAAGEPAEYLTNLNATDSRPATDLEQSRFHRLFQWVALNLSAAVAEDVRKFVQTYAT